nr:MAG TPA: shock protein B [Caudoviricetes sp.]
MNFMEWFIMLPMILFIVFSLAMLLIDKFSKK